MVAPKKHEPAKDAASARRAQPKAASFQRDEREHPLLHWQRTMGNRAVLRILQPPQANRPAGLAAGALPRGGREPGWEDPRSDAKSAEPGFDRQNGFGKEARALKGASPLVHEALNSPGQRLGGAMRTGLESHLGADFGDVILHTDGKAARSAGAVGARAYTVGNHIVFGDGQYRPGTLVGDALLAHEAAHVAQQAGGQARAVQDDLRLESEANAAGMSFVMSFGSFAMRAAHGLKSGIRLQRCPVSARQFNPPSYFGPYSRETMNTINNIMSAGASLQNWIAFGNAIAAFDDPLAGMHSAEAAEALRSVPTIIRARVNEEIDFLFVEHENDLNDQEKTFWNEFRKLL
jgi:Domain of unknown function (DUF4157)